MIDIVVDSVEKVVDGKDGFKCAGHFNVNGDAANVFHETIALLLSLNDNLDEGMFVNALGEVTKILADRQKRGTK